MSKTLFVNACMRGNESRTLQLCREYLGEMQDVQEVNLSHMALQPFTGDMVEKRNARAKAENWDDPMFDLAHQFAEAENIVIGAPYWDLSFPAALKIYIEHISVCNIVFRYSEEGKALGMCKAKQLTYITTCGGFLAEYGNYGYDYLCKIAKMFGIPNTQCIAAEGLDIIGMNVEEQMDKARQNF